MFIQPIPTAACPGSNDQHVTCEFRSEGNLIHKNDPGDFMYYSASVHYFILPLSENFNLKLVTLRSNGTSTPSNLLLVTACGLSLPNPIVRITSYHSAIQTNSFMLHSINGTKVFQRSYYCKVRKVEGTLLNVQDQLAPTNTRQHSRSPNHEGPEQPAHHGFEN